MYDRKTYFDSVRGSLFGGSLSQNQVDGQEALLKYAEDAEIMLTQSAYVLATAYHETAFTMQPIEEYGKGAGRPYGAVDPVTGWAYFGRGFVQLTWDYNYKSMGDRLDLDLYENAPLALDLEPATDIIFVGMSEGIFTGKKLADYITESKTDYVNARRIVNGTDKASTIADYANRFQAALEASYRPVDAEPDQPDPIDNEAVVNASTATMIAAVDGWAMQWRTTRARVLEVLSEYDGE